MESHVKLKIIAGLLLIASAVTHLLQLLWVGFEWHDIGAAIYGALYGALGILLILYKDNKLITIGGVILPTIGGLLGLYRLINIEIAIHGQINWFIVWHIIADLIVVPVCIYSYIHLRRQNGFNKPHPLFG
jgi:hypothetical protein